MIIITTYLSDLKISPDYAKYMLRETPNTTVTQLLVAIEKANIQFEGVFHEIVEKVLLWHLLYEKVKFAYDENENKVLYADMCLSQMENLKVVNFYILRYYLDRNKFSLYRCDKKIYDTYPSSDELDGVFSKCQEFDFSSLNVFDDELKKKVMG